MLLEKGTGRKIAASERREATLLQGQFDFSAANDPVVRRLEVEHVLPAQLGSHKRQLVLANDGRRHVTLGNDLKPGVALNEFLCSQFGEECGVPITPFSILNHSGTPCFASRYVCGRLSLSRLQQERVSPQALGAQLSAIYAFDQLMGNTDRTFENLFFLREDDRVVAEAIDFSEAGVFGENWNSPDPLRQGAGTNQTFDLLFPDFPENRKKMLWVLDRAYNSSPGYIDSCGRHLPSTWLKDGNAFREWQKWWSDSRQIRAEALYNYLNRLQ